MHGSGVGSGDHIAHSGLVGTGGNSLQTTGSLIVDLIAVNIDELIVLLSQIEANVEGLNRVLTGELEVRDSTGSVGAHLQGVFQQLFALGIAEDTILGEGDDLDIHEILDFVAQFQQRFHSGQLGIIDINMGTNMLDTIGGLHTDGLIDAILNFLLGEEGLILFPALDAFKQSAAHVPAGTAGGEAGIQVDMGLDDGGQGQLAAAINNFFAGEGFDIGDLFELTIGHTDIHGLGSVFDEQILKKHGFHSSLRDNIAFSDGAYLLAPVSSPMKKKIAATTMALTAAMPQFRKLATTAAATIPSTLNQLTTASVCLPSYFLRFLK